MPPHAPHTTVAGSAASTGVVDLREQSPAWAQAMAHDRGPMLVIGAAGTGKSELIAQRVAQSIRAQTCPAGQQLVLVNDRAAARRMTARIGELVGSGLIPPVLTIHSWALSILGQSGASAFASPVPRLLSAPEQEQRIRQLLRVSVAEGQLAWPASLAEAIGTRGIIDEIRRFMAHCRAVGVRPTGLTQSAIDTDEPEWLTLASFWSDYLDVIDAEDVIDYSELVVRATNALSDPGVADGLLANVRAIAVDDAQDIDPAGWALIRASVDATTNLLLVGDPDLGVNSFRGATPRLLVEQATGMPTGEAQVPIVVLDRQYRQSQLLRTVNQRVLQRVPVPLSSALVKQHRTNSSTVVHGRVEVLTTTSHAAAQQQIVDRVRRQVLGERGHWSEVAVIARTRDELLELQQEFTAAGVPVQLSFDDQPLAKVHGPRRLLDVVRLAAHMVTCDDDVSVYESSVADCLTGPIIGLSSATVRRWGIALRAAAAARSTTGVATQSAAELMAAAVIDDVRDEPLAVAEPEPVAILRELVFDLAELIRAEASIEQVLWRVWQTGTWAARLEQAALDGGVAGRSADRDLDAIVALFDRARRSDQRFDSPHAVIDFLDELDREDIAAAATIADRDAVELLTPYAARGRQWPTVVVVGLQEGTWPDTRTMSRLLGTDRLSADGVQQPATTSERIADERRLAHVAFSRAVNRLMIVGVDSGVDGAQVPSRFIEEVAHCPGVAVERGCGLVRRPASSAGLVAGFRAALEDPSSSPALRQAAAVRLAQLADQSIAPANPDNWWGLLPATVSDQPVRPPDKPVALSGSALTAIEKCSLSWFLEREGRAQTPSGAATAFGSLIHAIAEGVANGDLPDDLAELTDRLRDIWDALPYESRWHRDAEFDAAVAAIGRFLAWQESDSARELVATELEFDQTVVVTDPQGNLDSASLRGYVDRLELDEDGGLHIVDLKTEKRAKSAREVSEHHQLAVYQLAAEEGAFDDALGLADGEAGPPVAGAELVQLRIDAKGSDLPKVQQQTPEDSETVRAALAHAVSVIRSESFIATPSEDACRFCSFQRVCPAQDVGRSVTP